MEYKGIVRALIGATFCILWTLSATAQDSKDGKSSSKTPETSKAESATSATPSSTCTVLAGSSAVRATAAESDSESQKTGTETAAAPAGKTQAKSGSKTQSTSTARPASKASNSLPLVYSLHLPPGSTNAAEIASLLSGTIPGATSVTAVAPDTLVFLLDQARWVENSAKPGKGQFSTKEIDKTVSSLNLPARRVFKVNLPAGTGKACDVAHALVDAIPGILSITAVGETQLLITSVDSDAAESAAEAALATTQRPVPGKDASKRMQYEALVHSSAATLAVPAIPPSPHVESMIQRLFYVHDAAAVATVVTNALPNIAAQPLAPDLIVLTDSADEMDSETQRQAIYKARQLVARIDQPRPQLSVDAWSMQLTTDNLGDLRKVSDGIERAAAAYDKAIEKSRLAGWRYLSGVLADPGNLDPLLRQYLSFSTQINPEIAPAAAPDSGANAGTASGAANAQKLPRLYTVADPTRADGTVNLKEGYGLGYSSLYYPLNSNLLNMLVTVASLNRPLDHVGNLLEKMECDDKGGLCAAHMQNSQNSDSCQWRDREAYQPSDPKADIPDPERLQLECLRDVLLKGLLATNKDKEPLSTSALGQFRAALADFLFEYKIMVEYPDSFDAFLEPKTADTLDSSFNPLVIAFEQDVAELQHTLQSRCAQILKKKNVKGYGYSGLVNVKVLGSQQAVVNTSAQNFFDATPTASLNDLFANLGTQVASGTSLTSLFTGISPEKVVAILTALGTTLNPPKVTAHLGRELDLTVTVHTLSGAYGAELDVDLKSAENGASLYKQGVTAASDDLNSRVALHSVNTHVRVDSLRLLQLSTMGSVLARSQTPWKPFDPYIEIPGLDLLVKRPREAKEVFTRSLVFLDAMVVPTAADLGDGAPILYDIAQTGEKDKMFLHTLTWKGLNHYLPQYHHSIVDCLSHEYIGENGQIHVAAAAAGEGPGPACAFGTGELKSSVDPHWRSWIDPNPLSSHYFNAVDGEAAADKPDAAAQPH